MDPDVAALFREIDLLVLPVQPFASPTDSTIAARAKEPEFWHALQRYASPFDASGDPTITLPCGFTEAGMPLGFQVAAGRMREDLLVRAAVAFQAATDHHRRRPKPITP